MRRHGSTIKPAQTKTPAWWQAGVFRWNLRLSADFELGLDEHFHDHFHLHGKSLDQLEPLRAIDTQDLGHDIYPISILLIINIPFIH